MERFQTATNRCRTFQFLIQTDPLQFLIETFN